MNNRFAFRGVQLDLARQKEPIPFIKEFIDFIAASGFTTLFLYVEWRVRTKSFNALPDNDCYTEDEVKHIIAYAAKQNIDIIPGLATLGHCELFLNLPGNEKYSETNSQQTGRFWDENMCDLCPTHPEIRDILTTYISEVAEIFPSQYIHLGGDEIWNINCCDRCRAQGTDFDSEAKIYKAHFTYLSKFVSERLKRTPLLWDDMWEYYPDILEKMPHDLLMVHWQYQNDMTFKRGAFLNLGVYHWLKEYEKLNFKYLIAPAEFGSSSNARTFTEYADNGKNLAGGLLTSWSKHYIFMYRTFIRIAYCGALWNNRSGDLFKYVTKQLFGMDDKILVDNVKFFAEAHNIREYEGNKETLLTFDFFGLDYGGQSGRLMARNIFQQYLGKVQSPLGKKIIKDLILMYDYQNLSFRAHKFIKLLCNRTVSNDHEKASIIEGFDNVANRNTKAWNTWRKGVTPDKATPYYTHISNTFKQLCNDIPKSGILRIRFALPDKYALYKTTVVIKTDEVEIKAVDQVVKATGKSEPQFFERIFLIEPTVKPESIRLEGVGFGGTGFCYVEILTQAGSYIPHKIIKYTGTVETPEYILDNDCKWAFIGLRNVRKAYKNRAIATQASFLEIKMIKKA